MLTKALRGRIQTIKISSLEPSVQRKKSHPARFNSSAAAAAAVMRSLYVRIAKKDRKFIKGARLMANNLDSFLTESGSSSSSQMEDEEGGEGATSSMADHELDIYLMSRAHLSLTNHEAAAKLSGSARSSGGAKQQQKQQLRLLRFVNNINNVTSTGGRHCVCEKLRKTSRRINTKFLLLANVLRTRALVEGDSLGAGADLKRRRYKYRRDKHLSSPNRFSLRDGWKRGVPSSSQAATSSSPPQLKLIYLNAMFPWHRARAFIDYLENDAIDKRDMCKNVKRSVSEIYRVRDTLF